MEKPTGSKIYQDIARRTGGDIYIGVVGPVRTGKSMSRLRVPMIRKKLQKTKGQKICPKKTEKTL